MSAPTYSWQQKGWPRFTYNRAHLSDELSAFAKVSKPMATRELSELEKSGAIIAVGAGPQTRGYYIKQ